MKINTPQQPGPSNRKNRDASTIIAVLVLCFVASLWRAEQTPAAATASASNGPHASQADDVAIRKLVDEYVPKLMEKQAIVSLAYKRPLVPHWLYAACVRWNASYVDANDCLDRAVLTLPTGSVPGTWRLDANTRAEQRAYWSFADCDSSRVGDGGGVCVTN